MQKEENIPQGVGSEETSSTSESERHHTATVPA
jgi:hypothetical protein